jgi:hypothetical protein
MLGSGTTAEFPRKTSPELFVVKPTLPPRANQFVWDEVKYKRYETNEDENVSLIPENKMLSGDAEFVDDIISDVPICWAGVKPN